MTRRRFRVRVLAGAAVAICASAFAATPANAAGLPASYSTIYQTYRQSQSWDCGPWATRVALSTFRLYPRIWTLYPLEGTTASAGTDSITDVTYALNYEIHAAGNLVSYKSVFPAGSTATVKADLENTIYGDHGAVANIYGYANDVNGVTRGYGDGHYIAVVAYRNSGAQFLIADSGTGGPSGTTYWMTAANLTSWIAQGGSEGISVLK